jgi:hypothetical protein
MSFAKNKEQYAHFAQETHTFNHILSHPYIEYSAQNN